MGGLSDSVMAALIGGGVGLLTVAITVGGAAWVAARQLRHDREERATDRALQSKRDRLFASLSAASDMTRSISSLARPGSDISETADRFNAAVTGLAAAESVASLEVVDRGRELVGQAGVLFLIAMAKRASLKIDDRPRDGRNLEIGPSMPRSCCSASTASCWRRCGGIFAFQIQKTIKSWKPQRLTSKPSSKPRPRPGRSYCPGSDRGRWEVRSAIADGGANSP